MGVDLVCLVYLVYFVDLVKKSRKGGNAMMRKSVNA